MDQQKYLGVIWYGKGDAMAWCGIAQILTWYDMLWYGPVQQCMVWQEDAIVWYAMAYVARYGTGWYGMARGCSSVVVVVVWQGDGMVWHGMVWRPAMPILQEPGDGWKVLSVICALPLQPTSSSSPSLSS